MKYLTYIVGFLTIPFNVGWKYPIRDINIISVHINNNSSDFKPVEFWKPIWETVSRYQFENSGGMSSLNFTDYNFIEYTDYDDTPEKCIDDFKLREKFLNDPRAKETFDDFKNIDLYTFIFPHLNCKPYAGVAFLNGDTSWINKVPITNKLTGSSKEDYNLNGFYRTLLHEIGHNNALGHDNLKNYLSYLGLSRDLNSNYMVSSKWMWGWIRDDQIKNVGNENTCIFNYTCNERISTLIYSSDKNEYPDKTYGVRVYIPNEEAQIWIEHRSREKQPNYEGGLIVYWYAMKPNFNGRPNFSINSEFISIGNKNKLIIKEGEVFHYRIGDRYLSIKNKEYNTDKDSVKAVINTKRKYIHRKLNEIKCNSSKYVIEGKIYSLNINQYSKNRIKFVDCSDDVEAYMYRSFPLNFRKENNFNNYLFKIDECYRYYDWENNPQLSENKQIVLDWTDISYIHIKKGNALMEFECGDIIECPKNNYLSNNKCIKCPENSYTIDTTSKSIDECYEKCDIIVYDSVYKLTNLTWENSIVFKNEANEFIRKRGNDWEKVLQYNQTKYDKLFRNYKKTKVDHPNAFDEIECSCIDDRDYVRINGTCTKCPNNYINSFNDAKVIENKCHLVCDSFRITNFGFFDGVYKKSENLYRVFERINESFDLYMYISHNKWKIANEPYAHGFYAYSSMLEYYKNPIQTKKWYQAEEKYPIFQCLDNDKSKVITEASSPLS